MAKFMVCINGIDYAIDAQGRSKAVQIAINEHFGEWLEAKVTFARYIKSGVVYQASTAHGITEAIVKQ
jgi:hypothetical protein